MPRTVDLYEAKTQLSALVEDVASGDEVVIATNGVPKARLVPVASKRKRRRPHNAPGITFLSDDFDAWDADVERLYDEA